MPREVGRIVAGLLIGLPFLWVGVISRPTFDPELLLLRVAAAALAGAALGALAGGKLPLRGRPAFAARWIAGFGLGVAAGLPVERLLLGSGTPDGFIPSGFLATALALPLSLATALLTRSGGARRSATRPST